MRRMASYPGGAFSTALSTHVTAEGKGQVYHGARSSGVLSVTAVGFEVPRRVTFGVFSFATKLSEPQSCQLHLCQGSQSSLCHCGAAGAHRTIGTPPWCRGKNLLPGLLAAWFTIGPCSTRDRNDLGNRRILTFSVGPPSRKVPNPSRQCNAIPDLVSATSIESPLVPLHPMYPTFQ